MWDWTPVPSVPASYIADRLDWQAGKVKEFWEFV
jgi:hypothetical protein